MISLGLLARGASLRVEVVPEIARDFGFGDARLVAVNGGSGFEGTFIWGEIGNQLGKAAKFSKVWRDGAKSPSEKDWIELIGEDPTLILLDELPPYFDYPVTRQVGQGNLAQVTTYTLSNLLFVSLKLSSDREWPRLQFAKPFRLASARAILSVAGRTELVTFREFL
jgi:hypothetical protein